MITLTKNKQIQLLNLAKTAALKAGDLLRARQRHTINVNKSKGKDIKLAVDVESERLILNILKKNSEYSIFSEESGWSGFLKGKEPYWIVDPLDGSMNYLRKIPNCCVSIGLWQGLRPILGVVYDFNRDELFSGIAKTGAWLNGRSIKMSSVKNIAEAVLCTGFPVGMSFSEESIKGFVSQVMRFKKIRMLGSAALSLAYVAVGRVDAYFERDIMLWDVAGALPIIVGAKGYVYFKKSKIVQNAFTMFVSNKFLKNDKAAKVYKCKQ